MSAVPEAEVLAGPGTAVYEALRLANRGYHVFPIATAGATKRDLKVPLVKDWGNVATTDPSQVTDWWERQYPDAGIGIACEPSGLVVIDFDSETAAGRFHELRAGRAYDRGPAARTPRGGVHLYFKAPPGVRIKTCAGRWPEEGSGIDIRACGGYIAAPPTVLAVVGDYPGGEYAWATDRSLLDHDPPELPDWLAESMPPASELERERKANGNAAGANVFVEGQRNARLASAAGALRRQGAGEASVTESLLAINRNECKPPLDENEVRAIAHSIVRYAPEPDRLPHVPRLPVSLDIEEPPAPAFRVDGEQREPFECSDIGNGERFVAQWRGRIHYDHGRKVWMVWTGRRWQDDEGALVEHLAKMTVRSIGAEAAAATDDDLRKRLLKHAIRSEAHARVLAMLASGRSDPALSVTHENFDVDPGLLNVTNGVVDLRTGTIIPHAPEGMHSKIVPFAYDPAAAAPVWRRTLEEVLPDPGLRAWFQRFAGYCATGSVKEQALGVLYGNGANGKSTLVNTIRAVLADYATTATPELLLLTRAGAGPMPELARLRGARFVSCQETGKDRAINEALVKAITGGDRIAARPLYRDVIEFNPTHTVWLSTNYRPNVKDADNAIWRRLQLIPFEQEFPPERQDRDLPAKLLAEAEGVLAWIVEGAVAWYREGLGDTPKVKEATDQYRADEDTFGRFLDECCDVGSGYVTSAELRAAYKGWAEAIGETAMTAKAITQELNRRRIGQEKATKKARGREGLQLRDRPQLQGVNE